MALAIAILLAGCAGGSHDVVHRVTVLEDGVRVRTTVTGGTRPTAWAGFGLGPGAPPRTLDRIRDVSVRGADGTPLFVAPRGRAGYEIEVGDRRRWDLTYRLQLDEDPSSTFYRASRIDSSQLILVGSDAWIRLFGEAETLDRPPADRPPSRYESATVEIDPVALPSAWRVATAARRVAPDRYRIDAPHLGILALGPYRLRRAGRVTLAVHDRWRIAREQLEEMTDRIRTTLEAELGQPIAGAPLALFSPLPGGLEPDSGVTTAGMARPSTVLLFGDVGSGLDGDESRVRETLALLIAHELFHLYVPWGVPMTAELSWFSEGWATHVARETAVRAGLLSREAALARLEDSFRRYIDLGGHRAGSLPRAAKSLDESSDLLYLRGELVFRYLDREWRRNNDDASFDAALWSKLNEIYDGRTPLTPDHVRAALVTMVRPETMRRFVEGDAPLSRDELGL